MRVALVRKLSPRIAECELTFRERESIDFRRANEQHERYQRLLESLGCSIVHAEDLPDYPDGVFVEDAAIVLDEVAVITRPGVASRRGEVGSVAQVVERYRPIRRIEAPGTIDGGDVLHVGRTLYVGRGARTNDDAIEQLREFVAPFRYAVVAVGFRGCLHLKSAVTPLDDRTLLFNPDWVDPIGEFNMIAIDRSEPFAADILRIGDRLVAMKEHPRTTRRLRDRDYDVDEVAMGELLKAEAGVTCCSVIFTPERGTQRH